MDLRRLKTVFIVILLIANATLAVVIYSAEQYEQQEKMKLTENVAEILEKEMIYLPNDIVLPETPESSNYYLEKMFGSTKEMIVKFLGSDYVEISDRNYSSNEGTLFVNGDEFIFRKISADGKIDDFSKESVEPLCRNEMKRLGMMEAAYYFSGFNQIPNGTKAIFTVKHNDAVFFDAYVSFDVTEKGISAISGKNIISDLEVAESSNAYPDVEGILIGLIRSENLIPNVTHTVISVKHGYYIGRDAESYRNILAIPVWQVALDSGQIIHFDARNGKEIEE